MKNFSYTVLPVFMPIPTKFRLSQQASEEPSQWCRQQACPNDCRSLYSEACGKSKRRDDHGGRMKIDADDKNGLWRSCPAGAQGLIS